MKKNSFFLNKYTLSVIIVLVCLVTDVLLHKGESRVLLPKTFTDKRTASTTSPCKATLQSSDKHWIKAVNTPAILNELPATTPGFEMDVYFDTTLNTFLVYHDSATISQVSIEEILDMYKQKNFKASVWLDFKNLSAFNETQSLHYLQYIRSKYLLKDKMIIESSTPSCLAAFCEDNFFTSYYTPYINPYQNDEEAIIKFIDTIASNLRKYKISALSGYYFQYPVLKKYFPRYPILTWTDKGKMSIVASTFNRLLSNDESVMVMLSPL